MVSLYFKEGKLSIVKTGLFGNQTRAKLKTICPQKWLFYIFFLQRSESLWDGIKNEAWYR
jgi:hypothetical protein